LNDAPDFLQVHAKIIMNDDVTEPRNLSPRHLRMANTEFC
jgi:hypothetical protein